MEWMNEFKKLHRSGYIPVGKCLSCRRDKDTCPGGRFRNECPNYQDNTPTTAEYLDQYAELLAELFAAAGEPERGDLYGAAQSRRNFLRNWAGIDERDIRTAEDGQYTDTEENRRDLRRLRWEL
ncbi:MAG: hypothetical protein IJG15_07065 [Lachnospiraceae bacterium]|nr:hypothetical protein [Lachnospiraceae bacterium]